MCIRHARRVFRCVRNNNLMVLNVIRAYEAIGGRGECLGLGLWAIRFLQPGRSYGQRDGESLSLPFLFSLGESVAF